MPLSATANAVGFELLMVTVATLAPVAFGVNETLNVQDAPPAKLALQVLPDRAKSAAFRPVIVILVIASGAAPAAFDSVTS